MVDVLIPASIQEGVIVVNVPMNILFYLMGITVLKMSVSLTMVVVPMTASTQ